MQVTHDFYAGYEGYPEVCILKKNRQGQIVSRIRLWEGDFDAIMSLVEPNAKGQWEGIILNYHLASGWYEESPWQVPEPDLFLSQLTAIDSSVLEKKAQTILMVLKEALEGSTARGEDVLISYD